MKKLFLICGCDYIAALSEEQAKEFCKEIIGFSDEEISEFKEIPKEKWPSMTIKTDEFETSESGKEEQIILPFDEWMKQFDEKDLPCIVASTEC